MRRDRATAERAAPRLGILVSILLHLGLVVALFVSFSKKLDLPDNGAAIVPVDLVTIADQTNVAASSTPVTPPAVKDENPPPVPPVAPPKVDIAPAAKPKPATDADKFDVNDILKTLANKKSAKPGARDIQAQGTGNAMTADLRSVLRSEINRCWRRPDFGPNPERLVVQYRLFLNRDGTVAQPPQLTSASGDNYMRAAAESASRAIYACQPYKLPPDKYNLWRDSVVTFTPQDSYGP